MQETPDSPPPLSACGARSSEFMSVDGRRGGRKLDARSRTPSGGTHHRTRELCASLRCHDEQRQVFKVLINGMKPLGVIMLGDIDEFLLADHHVDGHMIISSV